MGLSSKQVSNDHLELNWTQTMLASNTINSSSTTTTTTNPRSTTTKRQLQTQPSDPLKCPRCDSINTKFCYYNNYNKTQPRHFCKACKRHWTKGGTLRNVPVGGGRKNKRIKRSNNAPSTAPATVDQSVLPLGFRDHHKEMFQSDKALFFKPIGNEGRSVLESYPNLDQVSWDFNGGFTGNPNLQQNLGFSMLSGLSSNIDTTNPNPILSNSFSPLLSGYKEDSTITTTRNMIMPSSSSGISTVSQPWLQQAPSTSNFLEASYWNWNDIDSMVLADLNKPFEDPLVKP